MDKPTNTVSAPLFTLDRFIDWLRDEAAQSKHRDALLVLALHSRDPIARGEEPPVTGSQQLRALYLDRFGGKESPDVSASKWLPTAQVHRWQDSRAEGRLQFLAAAGCDLDIAVAIDKGGGRNNQTTYQLRLNPMPIPESGLATEMDPATAQSPDELALRSDPSTTTDTAKNKVIYRMETATPSWLMLSLLGREPFHMRSVRGVFFILVVGLPFPLAALTCYASAFIVWTKATAFSSWLSPLAFTATIAAILTWSFRPVWRLPALRVTIAPEWAVGLNQFYAQLRLTRDNNKKLGGRFDLVRFHASCPVCAGTIAIRDGARGWPGRLIGCCSDNPREHVFSFDAVTLGGKLLIDR